MAFRSYDRAIGGLGHNDDYLTTATADLALRSEAAVGAEGKA
jgi:hypothetical protein